MPKRPCQRNPPGGGALPSINHIGMCRPKGWGLCATPFRSESGYRFWSFWSEIGYGFEETTEVSMNVFIVSTSNESERNSKMRMSDVRFSLSDVWYTDVRCLMFHVRYLMFDVWCLMSDVSYLMSDNLMSDVRSPISDVWCLMLMSDIGCLMSDVGCLVSHVW